MMNRLVYSISLLVSSYELIDDILKTTKGTLIMETKIYSIVDLSEQYNEPAYAIVHRYFGEVSVWDSLEFAERLYEDLELGIDN